MRSSGCLRSGVLGVIGTAGRRSDAPRMSPDLYEEMYRRLIETRDEWQVDCAVSGGAAWADHLAVRAFLEGYFRDLTLFLPAEFRDGQFVPDAGVQFNPGRTLNHYHGQFSNTCGIDSMKEIAQALARGARAQVIPGFHARNAEVARHSTLLLAFTFGKARAEETGDFCQEDEGYATSRTAGLKEGGTAHTWERSRNACIKRHCNLSRIAATLERKGGQEPRQGSLGL